MWDITNQPDRANIERILFYLNRDTHVPGEAITALEGLLARCEAAEQNARRKARRDKTIQHGARQLTVASYRGMGGYTRAQPLIEIAFTCAVCGKSQVVLQLPGKTPRYCPAAAGEKRSRCQRVANAKRVRAWRQHKAR